MAILLKTDGTRSVVAPKGETFEFRGELYDLLCTDMIEVVHLADGRLLLCDEEAKLPPANLRKPFNDAATVLLHLAGGSPYDYILGDVVICDLKELS